MSYHQPAGWGQRALIADPKAGHEIRIVNRFHDIAVTCACLIRFQKPPIGTLAPGADPHAIYATHHTATDGAA